MNQTYKDHKAYEWEGYYAYFSIVGGKLCLVIGVRTFPQLTNKHNIPPISRKEIDGYKVTFKYITYFLQVLYEAKIR
jgi:hypothetical protein